MRLSLLDWSIIFTHFLLAIVVVGLYIKRASRGIDEFFAAGRVLPWWLLGTSMVATTFSTDTPNLVTNLVRESGVAANWVWWAFLLTGMMTVFFYAKMWRRSGVLTDLEFYEIRYSGKSAALVRGFRAIYLGFFFNCVIMATVTLSAAKIANILFGWSRLETLIICSVSAVLFSATSGLWGVVVTDLFLFVMAMAGAVSAAYFSVQHPAVGGLGGLISGLRPGTLNLLPDFSQTETMMSIFLIPLAVLWWSVWYPGAEPGGGSYVAQRMLAARDEKNSMAAALWFNIAHYSLRPWPWIIVGLSSLLVYPNLSDIRSAFPHISPDLIGHDIAYPAMLTFLPHGFRGIMVASLIAAYLSTMDTSLNWGSSYLVNDFYKRFIRSRAVPRHYVLISRLTTLFLMMIAALVVLVLETARDSFDLLLSIGAGTGLIYLLRWYWWRINAWSEIAAMISSFCVSIALFMARKSGIELSTYLMLALSVIFTTIVWIGITLLTRPTDPGTLTRFYRLVRPPGRGWTCIRERIKLAPSPDSLPQCFLGWILGCVMVYSALFFTGNLLYFRTGAAIACFVPFAISGFGLYKLLPKIFRAGSGKQ